MYNKIEKLLKQKKVSAYKMCQDTGIDFSNLSRWKNGEYNPSIKNLIRMSKYFNVSVDYFL